MLCKHIIHVKAQKSADWWESMVNKALAHADKIGSRSISFPALGTGRERKREERERERFVLVHEGILPGISQKNHIIVLLI